MDIVEATARYEAWLRATLPVVIEEDLEFKHRQMATAAFPFLRASFYRWAQRFAELCPHLADCPAVLGVGDLHVENYGTWRDAEGRLVWGINDFDEATWLPYSADLVRVAASAALATGEHHLSVRVKEGAEALLTGYRDALEQGGRPFVLAENHHELRRLASGELRDPVRFWAKMAALPRADRTRYPDDALATLRAALPPGIERPRLPASADPAGPDPAGAARTAAHLAAPPPAAHLAAPPPAALHPPAGADPTAPHAAGAHPADVRARRAGLGSLGRPRLVALADWHGGAIAREVKAMVPSARDWAEGTPAPTIHYCQVIEQAVRCPDPCAGVSNGWLVRRLAPDCVRIELSDLPAVRDEELLLRAMGHELANIHLGTPGAGPSILADLAQRRQKRPEWLASAAERMAAGTEADWNVWRAAMGGKGSEKSR